MKAQFKFINPKVDLNDSYLEKVVEKLDSRFDETYTSNKIDENIWGISKYTQLNNLRKTTSAILHMKYDVDITYLDVQIVSGHASYTLDIAAATSAINKDFNEPDPIANEMKVCIKEVIIDDWENCVWIFDNDARVYSQELYPEIYMLENNLRRFIDELLTRKIGSSWWDTYVRERTKNKSNHNKIAYVELAPFYNDISINLFSIDIDDLNKIINTGRDYNNEQSKNIAQNLWRDIFSNYFEEEFTSSLEIFGANRNHVAHNKLIDHAAYIKIKNNLEDVSGKLNNALEKYNLEVRGSY